MLDSKPQSMMSGKYSSVSLGIASEECVLPQGICIQKNRTKGKAEHRLKPDVGTLQQLKHIQVEDGGYSSSESDMSQCEGNFAVIDSEQPVDVNAACSPEDRSFSNSMDVVETAGCDDGKRTPDEKKARFPRYFFNPFFVTETERESLQEQYDIDPMSFSVFEEEFSLILDLTFKNERLEKFESLKKNAAVGLLQFLETFQRPIRTMVEYGAVRNTSLATPMNSSWKASRIKLGKKLICSQSHITNRKCIQGHWGEFFETTVDNVRCVVKEIKLSKVELKARAQYENPLTEMDLHRFLEDNRVEGSQYLPKLMSVVAENNRVLYVIEKGEVVFDFLLEYQNKRKKYPCLKILAKTLFHDYLRGLDEMHQKGVSHGDLKLENMIFTEDFAGLRVGKNIDLGSAVRHPSNDSGGFNFSMSGMHKAGTVSSMSPERRFHRAHVAKKYLVECDSDVWKADMDDLWQWAYTLLTYKSGGRLFDYSTKRPQLLDKMTFHIATNCAFADELGKQKVKSFFKSRKLEEKMGINGLLGLRRCPLLDEDCLDLLSKILVPVSQRITVKEALKHKYFNLKEFES